MSADPLCTRIAVTTFAGYGAASKRERRITLADLAREIADTTAPRKDALPWLKLARFGNTRTGKGSLRHDANVLTISGIETDYDGGTVTVDEAFERLTKQGIAALVYTSPSHTEDAPRWRILCPLSAEAEPARREHLVGRLNGMFGGALAGESFTLSQAYYYGSVCSNPSHRVELIDGTPIDTHDDLDTIWRGRTTSATPNAGTKQTSALGLRAADALLVAVAACVIPNSGAPDWDAWNRRGMQIFAASGGSELGRVTWHAWSARNPSYNSAATEARWQHIAGHPPTGIGAGSLFRDADLACPGWRRLALGAAGQPRVRPALSAAHAPRTIAAALLRVRSQRGSLRALADAAHTIGALLDTAGITEGDAARRLIKAAREAGADMTSAVETVAQGLAAGRGG